MFERVIKLVREEKVSLFIGAGFSIEAHAPSVAMLREAILTQFDNDQQRSDHKNDSLAEISDFFVEEVCCGSRNSLIELLQKQFQFTPAKMDDHQALAKIPHFHNIFTTNYDTLLEDSYTGDICQVIRKDADCAYLDDKKPVKVFKIHGDFTNQDFVVITSSDYDNFYKQRPNPQMWDIVKNEFLTKHILFIGYSLTDDNILDIISNISQTVNKNQKDMFLIAPKISPMNQGRLKKMKVHYYDAFASDFFAELKKALDENIGMDFRHHKVSAETFARYCQLHGFNPDIVINQKKDNDISNIKALPGQSLKHTIQMTVKSELKDLMKELDFEKYGELVEDSPFPNLRLIKIEEKDLLNCSYSVNGVVVQNEIERVLVGPVVNDLVLTIRIPAKGFIEKISAKTYRVNNRKVAYKFDCNIYTVELTAEIKEVTDEGALITYNLSFSFKDTYTDNSEALKWIEFIDAFFNDCEIIISIDSYPLLNTNEVQFPKKENKYGRFRHYYQNIKQIELLTGKSFTEYKCYNEERYKLSRWIVAYLTHQTVTVKASCSQFSVEVNEGSFLSEQAKKDNVISVVTTETGGKSLSLNGRTFDIPFTHTLLNECKIVDVKKKRKKVRIDFDAQSTKWQILFSDKSANEEFPGLKQLDDHV
jgi:hypothetical protein